MDKQRIISDIEEKYEFYISQLNAQTVVHAYLDLTNMFYWQDTLKWKFRIKDIVRQLQSLKVIKEIKIYYGVNERDKEESLAFHRRLSETGAIVRSKPVKYILDKPKCNFDVEMTMDLLDDADKVSAVMLFSGDSDMHSPLERLKVKGRKIFVVGVRGRIASELHEIKDTYIDFGLFYRGVRRYNDGTEAKIPPEAGPRD